MKTFFKLADALFPSMAAKQVYKVMSNPRVRKLRAFEEEILAKAVKERIAYKNGEIQLYKWGNSTDKTIFLVHGWEGQAGNFGGLIDILLKKKYYVVAFDAPSHGRSTKRSTNMFEFVELVTKLVKTHQPASIISHSFGSVTTLMVLSNLREMSIEQWFVVTTPHNFKDRINDVKQFLGVTERTIDKVIYQFESDTGYKLDNLNVDYYGDKVPHVKEVVIVHSKSDKILPIDSARFAHKAIPHSELIELDDLGHYAILWSDALKEVLKTRLKE
ncbi:MAG: alpha/beta fold hydrolase [Saprospiraceae bacterium]